MNIWNEEVEEKIINLLQEHDNIGAIFTHSDEMAKGAYHALLKLGYKESEIPIIGVGGVKEKSDYLHATFKSESWGKKIIDNSIRILKYKEFPKRLILDTEIIIE